MGESVANGTRKTLNDEVNNGRVCGMAGVDRLEEFFGERELRWLGREKRVDEGVR